MGPCPWAPQWAGSSCSEQPIRGRLTLRDKTKLLLLMVHLTLSCLRARPSLPSKSRYSPHRVMAAAPRWDPWLQLWPLPAGSLL